MVVEAEAVGVRVRVGVGPGVGVRVRVGVGPAVGVRVRVGVGFVPPPTQLLLPESVKFCPAIGTNCQS